MFRSMADYSPILLFAFLSLVFPQIRCDRRVTECDDQRSLFLKNLQKSFRHYELITPEVYHNGKLLETASPLRGHHRDLTVIFNAFNKEFILDLKLNSYLFGRAYVEKTVHEADPRETIRPVNHTEQHCYYHGVVRSSSSSSSSSSVSTAAIGTCCGIRGQFTVKNVVYLVEPAADALPSLSSVHFIFRNSDVLTRNSSCGENTNQKTKRTDLRSQMTRMKKSVENRVRVMEPTDSDDATRYVELYVVNDFTQYVAFNRRAVEVIQRTKDIVNIVSSIYRPLGIYVILVGIEVWTEQNLIEVNGNPENTLNQFLEYRRKYISPFHRNDNAQLIIGRDLGNGIVGKAPLMSICTFKLSGGVNADRHTSLGSIATTVAHEMGHNFGLPHDNTSGYQSCECEDSHCVMSGGGSSSNPTKWSSCSKQILGDAFHQGMDYCLRNIPETTNLGAVCGNGYMEDGEECDCGIEQDCKSKCCIASTCRLAPNATCASGKCCNLATCQPLESATVCRRSRGSCDLPEFCDGESERCPSDAFVRDGVDCEDNSVESFCYRGSCRTHDSQCRMLWGRTGKMSNEMCFERYNVIGGGLGHCGFNWVNESFTSCEPKDVMCGMLHCQHQSEKLMFWKEALMFTMPDSSLFVDGVRYDCKAAIMDVGLDMPDPGMTFDGVKCGDKQMCLSHRCVSVEVLDAPSCQDCNGHGVCNSLGQCHCDLNYAPPYCQNPGTGGSFHSGPAQKYPPNSGVLVLGLCLFLLVVLPFCVVLVVLFYRNYSCVKFFALQWCQRCQSNNFFSSETQKSSGDLDLSLSSAVAVDDGIDAAAALKSPGARRAVSFQPEDISRPLLQSCTNSSLDSQSTRAPRAALTHAKSCRAPNARDGNETFVKMKSKMTNLNDNEDGNRSVTSLASDESSAAGTTDMQTLLPKHCNEPSTRFPAPLRPAPPPPPVPPPAPPPPPPLPPPAPPHSFASPPHPAPLHSFASPSSPAPPRSFASSPPPRPAPPHSFASPPRPAPPHSIASPSSPPHSFAPPSPRHSFASLSSPSTPHSFASPPRPAPPHSFASSPPPAPPHSIASPSSPPYARPMKIMVESNSRVTRPPPNSNNLPSSKSENQRSVVVSNSPKPQKPPFDSSAQRRRAEIDNVPLHTVPEKKSGKPSTDRKTENPPEPQTNSVSRLRRTFEANNSSSDPASDVVSTNRKISFQPIVPKVQVHPSSAKVSSHSQSAEPPSKPAVPKRPALVGRPETFSTGTRVRQAAGQLQHRASEAGVKTNENPPHVTKPVPR